MALSKLPKRVGARELKTRLGRYIRAARDGVTIVVTERGEAVAELRPIAPPTGAEARLEEMAATGTLSRGSSEQLPSFRPVKVAGAPVSRTIIGARADRF